jgi:hypothetical protein
MTVIKGKTEGFFSKPSLVRLAPHSERLEDPEAQKALLWLVPHRRNSLLQESSDKGDQQR